MKQRQKSLTTKAAALRGMALTLGLSMLAVVMAPPAYGVEAPASAAAAAADNVVKGVVTDTEGEPLIGVNVKVEGVGALATTNINGEYEVKARPGQYVTFSYVGYKSTTLKVTGGVLDVVLENQNALDEVVVVGYGTVRKADLAGAVSVLDGKAFQAQPITQVSDALQGRVTGVNIVSDGLPGGNVKIRVRGSNSINKSNEPLYVVDGLVRESGLQGINPEDIASMQILKDASSTAIYGSRGANGVVIITTKKGRVGESKLTLDVSLGWATATNLPKMLGTVDYANALVNYAGIPEVDVADYINGKDPGIDWQDEIFRTGKVQNYKLVFSKGSEAMQFYLSANYMRHDGVIDNTKYERYSFRGNMQADINSWLNVNLDVNMSHSVGSGLGEMAQGGYNPVYVAFNSSPTMAMYTADGRYARDPYCTIQDNARGIIYSDNERRRDILNGHVDLRFKILPGLTFTTSNGVDYYNTYNYGMSSTKASPTAHSGMSNSNSNRWLLQTTNNLTYIGTFNEKHNLTATAVWEATKYTQRNMGISGTDLLSEKLGWWNVAGAATRNASNGYSSWSLLSGVARVIYNFDNRYMVTGTLRADGSSRLSNNKWSWFPSIAAAWTVSNEDFFESLKPTFSSAKLRMSYGVIGNQDIAPYETLARMSQTSTYFSSSTGLTGYWANQVDASNLKWERTKQFDIGFDLGFFNGRLDFTFDYYYKYTTDALLRTSLADYLGGAQYWVNGGEVSNTGVDLGINASVIESTDWNWTSALNLSFNRNRVEKMTALEPRLYSGSMQSIVTDAAVIMEGEPIGSLYGQRWAGIDSEGYDTYYTKDGEITRTPGDDDRVILGKANPTMTLGWNNTVTWKNWSLNAFFTGAFGAKRLNTMRFAMCSMIGNSRMFTSPDALELMGTEMPDPRVANNQYIGASSKWVENANYFRLDNLTLGYDLKKEVTRFADIHLSFSIQNLFTITSYKGLNPASYSFGGDGIADWAQGIDTGVTPCPRTYTIGARFTF